MCPNTKLEDGGGGRGFGWGVTSKSACYLMCRSGYDSEEGRHTSISGSEVSSPVMGSIVNFPVCASVAMYLRKAVCFWNLATFLAAGRAEARVLDSTRVRNSGRDITVRWLDARGFMRLYLKQCFVDEPTQINRGRGGKDESPSQKSYCQFLRL